LADRDLGPDLPSAAADLSSLILRSRLAGRQLLPASANLRTACGARHGTS